MTATTLASDFMMKPQAHTRMLSFLANDVRGIVAWGASCRLAYEATNDEATDLWCYVWTAGLRQSRPLGTRQVRRAKAHCLKAIVRKAEQAQKVCRLSVPLEAYLRKGREDSNPKFSALSHIVPRNYYPFPCAPQYRCSKADYIRLNAMMLREKLEEQEALLAEMDAYRGFNPGLVQTASKALMKKKLKRKKRKNKPKKKKPKKDEAEQQKKILLKAFAKWRRQ